MWAVTNVAAAEVAIVLSSAVPIDPPICCATLTVADATPASSASMPAVPRLKAGEDHRYVRTPAIAVGDDPQRQQRVRHPALRDDEAGEQQDARDQETDRLGVRPPGAARLGGGVREAVDDGEHARRGEDGAEPV